MTDSIKAADLPDGSVVSGERTTYVKDHPSPTAAWRGTRGGHHRDWEVDEALAEGAEVLRGGATPTKLADNRDVRKAVETWLANPHRPSGPVYESARDLLAKLDAILTEGS